MRIGTENGAFFGAGLRLGGAGCLAEFAMDFVWVGVGQERVAQTAGPCEFADLIGGEERRQTFLPVVVAAFDFALGLGRGRVAQGDAIEVQRGAGLGEGVWVVGVKE